jgi:hypothetical protein
VQASLPHLSMNGGVIRLRGTLGTFVGYVNAPDQEQAIQKAAKNFGIGEKDRWQLGARSGKSSGELHHKAGGRALRDRH